ncbi:MAG: hypothetical protein ACFFG0_26520 [Candidatus Thorarchaeota archaeon]
MFSITQISRFIVNEENIFLPVSTHFEDFYVVNDTNPSLSCIINKSGAKETLNIKLNDEKINNFKTCANKRKYLISKVGPS